MLAEYEYSGKAMGTEYVIVIVSDNKDYSDNRARHAVAKILSYEAIFSRFLSQSELSILNQCSSLVVSEEFYTVIVEAFKLFTRTHGLFNPLVQIARFGYTSTFESLSSEDTTATSDEPYNIDFTQTNIEEETRRITLSEGQKLDFGGFLKGYVSELIARELYETNEKIAGVLINIGGDIHTRGYDAVGEKFIVSIYNPLLDSYHMTFPLYNRSLATSGIYKRTWMRGGIAHHHILDASGTRNPDNGFISASIVHPHGSFAEAYAKVFLLIGPDEALTLLPYKDYSYLMITKGGEIITNIPLS